MTADRETVAADARALGLALADDQIDRLAAFVALLARWNQTYNLTAIRDTRAMHTHHVADCLAAVAPFRRELATQPDPELLDVGSGAGLPGLVLAVVQPRWRVTCVDAVAKKAAFVRQAAGELGLTNLEAHHGRVEQIRDRAYDLITSRAFASVADFVGATRHLQRPSGLWAAMKGHRPDDELAQLPPDIDVFHVEPLTVPRLDAQRCLVWMRAR